MGQTKIYQCLAKVGRLVEFIQLRMMLKYGMKPYQPLPFDWVRFYDADRKEEASWQRWELIRPYLPKKTFSALDFGCNIGFFSFKLAENGAGLVVGIDTERGAILAAEKIKQLTRVQNVAFCQHEVTQENVFLLGEFDVILFMSVFHHINYKYDMDEAKIVLKELIKRTREVMFFETGQGDQSFGVMATAMPKIESKEALVFVRELLCSCGAKTVKVLGKTEVKLDSNRYLFAVSR